MIFFLKEETIFFNIWKSEPILMNVAMKLSYVKAVRRLWQRIKYRVCKQSWPGLTQDRMENTPPTYPP